MALLGIDVGTSGCKASVMNYEGQIIGSAYQEYDFLVALDTGAQIDAERVWSAVKSVVKEVVSQSKISSIDAIGATSFGESVVFVDQDGNSLAESILYYDHRGSDQVEWMYANLDIERFYQTTGVSPNATYSLAKIMWVRDHDRPTYDRAEKIMLFADFILYRFGAPYHSSHSLAARTMAFDVFNKVWATEILNACDVRSDIFPMICEPGSLIGEIRADLAAELGIQPGARLMVGGHDQVFAALGAGIIGGGLAVDGLGTTECITPVFPTPQNLAAMNESSLACVPFLLPDTYVTYAYTLTSGSVLKWFRDYFVRDWRGQADEVNLNIYDYMIEKAIGCETDVMLLPHLAGSATPFMDADSRGALIGITLTTSREEVARAIIEAINFEMLINLERLNGSGIPVSEVRVVGGLSKSDLFLQLKSDIMGIPVTRIQTHEAGTLGIGILASVAVGHFSSIQEAVQSLVKTTDVFRPDPSRHAAYLTKFERYKKLYPAIRPLFD